MFPVDLVFRKRTNYQCAVIGVSKCTFKRSLSSSKTKGKVENNRRTPEHHSKRQKTAAGNLRAVISSELLSDTRDSPQIFSLLHFAASCQRTPVTRTRRHPKSNTNFGSLRQYNRCCPNDCASSLASGSSTSLCELSKQPTHLPPAAFRGPARYRPTVQRVLLEVFEAGEDAYRMALSLCVDDIDDVHEFQPERPLAFCDGWLRWNANFHAHCLPPLKLAFVLEEVSFDLRFQGFRPHSPAEVSSRRRKPTLKVT